MFADGLERIRVWPTAAARRTEPTELESDSPAGVRLDVAVEGAANEPQLEDGISRPLVDTLLKYGVEQLSGEDVHGSR